MPRKPSKRPVRKLRFNTLLHPPPKKQNSWTVETLDVPMGHSPGTGYPSLINTIISMTIYKEFMYSENGCERCMSVQTMDVENENENEWISLTVCASIDSAL